MNGTWVLLAVAFNRAVTEKGAQALNFKPIVRRDRSEQWLYSEALLRAAGLPFGAGTSILFRCWSAWDLFARWTGLSSQRFSVS
ncbi:MAG: hypothetical protein CPDRYMAC_1579 [uncultured Paraburkholderia sp.]|nr:MAG: hypothetical protein CPDRYDRY_1551 [uncultured Paraburkholderia sp.]CAH2919503.1 MAG: hypothetical protein CPDRYMAC_1579 [uncultured Paraburkholderia sp.]